MQKTEYDRRFNYYNYAIYIDTKCHIIIIDTVNSLSNGIRVYVWVLNAYVRKNKQIKHRSH